MAYELIFDQDETYDDPWKIAADNDINVLSHLDWHAGYVDDEGNLVAALFAGVSGDEYEFDIVVAPEARRQGLAGELMDLAIENYEELLEPFPDLMFDLDVVNPIAREMLEARGFKVVGGTPDRPRMSRNPGGWEDELADVGAEVEGGSVWLYHATTPRAAQSIVREGVLRTPKGAPDTYGVYGTTSLRAAREDSRGGAVVRFLVPLEDIEFEDYFPGRELWAQIDTRRGVYRPQKIGIADPLE
jgi:GNAT superfamily N-acetyltransferase